MPPQVIEVAQAALLPDGWASQPMEGFVDASKCQRATLGTPYRSGTVDTRKLNGSVTPDDFVVIFDEYRIAWFCDGVRAGRLDVRLHENRWQVVGHGDNTEWVSAIDKHGFDLSPACTPAYLLTYGLRDWVILADNRNGLVVQPMYFSAPQAHTKDEFVQQVIQVVGR